MGLGRRDVPFYRFGFPKRPIGPVFDLLVYRPNRADVAAKRLNRGFEFGDPCFHFVESVDSIDRFVLRKCTFDGIQSAFDAVAVVIVRGHASGCFGFTYKLSG